MRYALNDDEWRVIQPMLPNKPRDGSRAGLTRGEAVKRIHQLGFTEGDAERWLGSKPRSKLIPRE